MKADQPKPTAPAAAPPVLTGVAAEPLPDAHQGHVEPNALLTWLQSFWDKLKAGQLAGGRWLALLLAVALIGISWWYLARASRQTDSALWTTFSNANTTEGLKQFVELPANAKTDATRIARVNIARNMIREGLPGLAAAKAADRQKAAKAIAEGRDELVGLAAEFTKDRTMKAVCLLAAADAELALVGVPKEGVRVMPLEVQPSSRGQVERAADLLRQAADTVGPDTDAGKKHKATADKYAKDAAEIYKVSGYLHAAFNEPDPEEPKPALPPAPAGITPITPADTPKAPDKPIEPVNPLTPPKTDEKKPDDGPKPPAPLAPANTDKK
jgi:hypothetical protein